MTTKTNKKLKADEPKMGISQLKRKNQKPNIADVTGKGKSKLGRLAGVAALRKTLTSELPKMSPMSEMGMVKGTNKKPNIADVTGKGKSRLKANKRPGMGKSSKPKKPKRRK
tara:strand:+ start:445 stop:780 length:336 start_codon:yes stop_codon:yes gene_type:complete